MLDSVSTQLLLEGHSNRDAKQIISQHAQAVGSLANCVRSTLGPFGLNKLMVDETGETAISNDGNTILQHLQVDNPIVSLIIDLSSQQEKEVGDGTTSMVLIASELLNAVEKLHNQNIHSSEIISGLKVSCRYALKHLANMHAFQITNDDHSQIMNVAKTSISSKILSQNSDFFASMAIKACLAVENRKSKLFQIENIATLKAIGRSVDETQLIDGFAFNCSKAAQEMADRVTDAKIACLDFNLSRSKAKFGVQVVVSDSESLEQIRKKELEMSLKNTQKIIDAGTNVIFTTGSIDEDNLRLLIKNNIFAVKFVDRKDLKKISIACGATLLKSLSYTLNASHNHFDSSLLGSASAVSQMNLQDNKFIVVEQPSAHSTASLLIRGPSEAIIEEAMRSFHDCLSSIKRTLESKQLVCGGGSSETAMSAALLDLASKTQGKEQLVIREFAKALQIIPKQLAVNSGADSAELVGNLLSSHFKGISEGSQCFLGLDLEQKKLIDCREKGILDPLVSKVKILRKATEAVIVITKIDNVVKNNREKPEEDECGY
ncbi:MAG: assists the folding of proteins upon ATP hydrolysis [Paramarteilia canceri]